MSIVLTLMILSILVIVHEWGHYIVSKKIGVGVEEFSIGLGPTLYAKEGKETLFSIRALPIGGFCRLRGEAEDAEEQTHFDSKDLTAFVNRTKFERFLILLAGSGMNFIFGIFCLLFLGIYRDRALFSGIQFALTVAYQFFVSTFQGLAMLFTGGAGLNDVAGPIGMVQLVSEVTAYGWPNIVFFMALLSINLGVLNLFPFPALDGGQILVIIIEKIIGKDIPQDKVGYINLIGMMLLLSLAVLVAINDIRRITG